MLGLYQEIGFWDLLTSVDWWNNKSTNQRINHVIPHLRKKGNHVRKRAKRDMNTFIVRFNQKLRREEVTGQGGFVF